jgi:hypothetical protein
MTPGHPAPPGPIAELLGAVRLAPRQVHETLTIWPLVRDETTPRDGAAYVHLSEALRNGTFLVDEVSEAGSVPSVRAANRGDTAVLILFGEEFLGARQNRVANASFLVAPGDEVVIDVSSVEQGRWERSRNGGFSGLDSILSHALRLKMHRRVSKARASGRGFRADQGEVWEEVADRIIYAGAESMTAAYDDYVRSRLGQREEIVRAFKVVSGQTGFVAAMNDEIVGLEGIGDPAVFSPIFPNLLRSYAIDAVDAAWLGARGGGGERKPVFDSPEAFLDAVRAAEPRVSPSLGLGEDLRLDGPGVSGCALVEGGRLIHTTVFVDAEGPPEPQKMRPWFWQRREETGA